MPTLIRPSTRVLVKKNWSETWEVKEFLEPLAATDCAGPEMPKAQFRWRAGHIRQQGETRFKDYFLLEMLDWFVRIEFDRGSGWEKLWEGRFAAEDVEYFGLSQGPTADQQLVAYGLQYELDRRTISTSWITNDDEEAEEIGRCLVFNDDYVAGFREIGNRSEAKVRRKLEEEELGSVTPPEAYAFANDKDDDGKRLPWTVRDIVEYLLTFWDRSETEDVIRFVLGGQDAALDTVVYPEVRVEGMTIFRALNELIDRRRGLGWCVRREDDATDVTIHIFTTVGEEVSVGDKKLPANDGTVTLDADDSAHIVAQERSTRDTFGRYGQIVIEGELVLVCFTASIADETLTRGWTTDEQTGYKIAFGLTTAAQADDYRTLDEFAHVFTKFVIPKTWNWEVGGGEGGDKTQANRQVLDADGTINITTNLPLVANVRQWGHKLLRSLPLRKAEADEEAEPEYREPFVLLRKATVEGFRWVCAEDPDGGVGGGGHVRMLDRDFGVSVHFSPAHKLALGDWSDAAPTQQLPVYDPGYIVATVAARTDERVRVAVDLPEGDPNRVLTLRVPDAEFWWIVKNTVISIDSEGELVREPESRVLRDDSKRLMQIAALAKAWYGVPRASINLTQNIITKLVLPGNYIASIGGVGESRPVNSVASRVEWDLNQATTTIITQFGELDVTAGGHVARHTLR